MCLFVFTCALAGAIVSAASAQSLADVARKEGERRQEVKPAGKTYTNTDLKGSRTAAADPPSADAANPAASGDAASGGADGRPADAATADTSADTANATSADAAAGDVDRSRDLADASATDATPSDNADAPEAAADQRGPGSAGASDPKSEQYWADRISHLREQLERNETYLSALQSRVNALTTDFVNRDDPAQRTQISGERQRALAELQRLEQQIRVDRKAIPELEEEARRAGVPAGWLR